MKKTLFALVVALSISLVGAWSVAFPLSSQHNAEASQIGGTGKDIPTVEVKEVEIISMSGSSFDLYAKVDVVRGAWKAPAGTEATLRSLGGVVKESGSTTGVTYGSTSDLLSSLAVVGESNGTVTLVQKLGSIPGTSLTAPKVSGTAQLIVNDQIIGHHPYEILAALVTK